VPPTVRIFISDKQLSLNVAIRNGEVVLATATYDHGDNTQVIKAASHTALDGYVQIAVQYL
jgi:hypothetical protein